MNSSTDPKPIVSLIVAMAENRVIGRGGELPWRLSSDLRRFKRLTMGHHVVMGRRTFESIGRLLPGRTTIVVTRQPRFDARGALVASSLAEALRLAAGDAEVFIAGGGEIYRAAMDHATRIYLTRVAGNVAGDTFFPELERDRWRVVEQSEHAADERNDLPHRFEILERTGGWGG